PQNRSFQIMVRGVAVLFAGHHCPEVYLIGIVPPVLLVIMPIQTEVLLGRRRRAEHRRKNNSQDDCNSPTAHIGPPHVNEKTTSRWFVLPNHSLPNQLPIC